MTEIITFNETDIPNAVLLNMVRRGAIPTEPVRWLDERIGCRRARQDDPRQGDGCKMLARNSDGSTWCRLNGRERATPCVFDEPESAAVWGRIEEQRDIEREIEKERAG